MTVIGVGTEQLKDIQIRIGERQRIKRWHTGKNVYATAWTLAAALRRRKPGCHQQIVEEHIYGFCCRHDDVAAERLQDISRRIGWRFICDSPFGRKQPYITDAVDENVAARNR